MRHWDTGEPIVESYLHFVARAAAAQTAAGEPHRAARRQRVRREWGVCLLALVALGLVLRVALG